VLFSGSETNSTGNYANITGISGLGLTWTKRSSQQQSVTSQQTEIWYAINSGTSATGTVTVTYSTTFDDQAMIITSWSGCNLTNPWSASTPAFDSSSGTGTPTLSLTTTAPYTTGIAVWGTPNQLNGGAGNWVGWNLVTNVQNSGGAFFQYMGVSYKQFSTNQTALSVTTTNTISIYTANGDALVSAQ
jgi:hypothetical protein